MNRRGHVPWENLAADSARDAIVDIVCLLANGFTGRIVLDCVEGGVRNFEETRRRQSGTLGKLADGQVPP